MPRKSVTISPTQSPIYLPWEKLSTAERHREIIRHAQRHRGYAVTVNLKPEYEEYLHSQAKPMRIVSKRMNAELNRLDMRRLPVLMVLESTRPEGRLHLHGVYMESGYGKPRIQEAMRRATGYIPGRSGSRQFCSKLITAADGWDNYLRKDCRWTKRILKLASDGRLWWVSHPMTQVVPDEYEAVRLGHAPAADLNNSLLSAR